MHLFPSPYIYVVLLWYSIFIASCRQQQQQQQQERKGFRKCRPGRPPTWADLFSAGTIIFHGEPGFLSAATPRRLELCGFL